MKITGRKSQQIGQPMAPTSPLGGGAAPDAGATARPDTDQVSLASSSQIRHLAETANALPTVRTEKVAELRGAIDEGSYYVESDKLARKVVDECINDLLANEVRAH